MEKNLTITIDATPLKELQETLLSISKSLESVQARAEKGLTIATNISSILSAAMTFEKFNKAANSAVEQVAIKVQEGFIQLKRVIQGFSSDITGSSKTVKSAMGDISDTVEKSAKKTSKTKFSFGGIAAVATVVATLVGYFVDMLSTNEALSEKMGKIWEKITEALSPVIEVVTGLFDSFINGGEGTSSILDTVVEVITNVATFIGEVITQIVTFFQENSEVIGGIVSAVWGVISGIIEVAKEIFAGVFEIIGGFFEEHGDTVMAVVETVWGFISSILDGAAKIFGGIFDVIVGIFTGNGEKIKEGVAAAERILFI